MKCLLIFAAGLAIGAVAGACVIKNKVQADAKEEIEEVREYYRTKKLEQTGCEEVSEVEETTDDEQKEFTKKDYINYSNIASNYNTESVDPCKLPDRQDDPYVIDPEDFGSEVGYDTMTLTYFADGVLVDDVDDVVDEPDIVVGLENLKVFSELGASSVYVRNDIYRTDYEILRDDWNWSDLNETPEKPAEPIKEKKPHQL